MSMVSEMMNIPENTLSWYERKYFSQKLTSKDDNGWVTLKNITDEEVMFIINQNNLRRWAYLSIPKRCVIFHRTFTNRRIKKGVMLKVMHQAGLMKKKVEISNVAARKEERVDEFN